MCVEEQSMWGDQWEQEHGGRKTRKCCALGSFSNVHWKGWPPERSDTENDLGMDCPR